MGLVAVVLQSLVTGMVGVDAANRRAAALEDVEDVEAVRRSGSKQLQVAMGTIVTPLAAQRASEWGIEVSFQ